MSSTGSSKQHTQTKQMKETHGTEAWEASKDRVRGFRRYEDEMRVMEEIHKTFSDKKENIAKIRVGPVEVEFSDPPPALADWYPTAAPDGTGAGPEPDPEPDPKEDPNPTVSDDINQAWADSLGMKIPEAEGEELPEDA